MEYSTIGTMEVSRFGVGTKSMPMQSSSRVPRLDTNAADEIVNAALEAGVNYFDTSYSNAKGEAESYLGKRFEGVAETQHRTATSFFELVDPRFEYVFSKQLKKLGRDCIDFYHLASTCNLTRTRDIDSGAIDFLFAQKEAGKIANLGFTSELDADNLAKHLDAFPWDFVRMKVNFFDWFTSDLEACYELAKERGIPVIAHAPLHVGNVAHLKPKAIALLKEHAPQRTEIDWCLRFVKSLEAVRVVSCNVRSTAQLAEDVAVFEDGEVLGTDDLAVLEDAVQAQKTVRP